MTLPSVAGNRSLAEQLRRNFNENHESTPTFYLIIARHLAILSRGLPFNAQNRLQRRFSLSVDGGRFSLGGTTTGIHIIARSEVVECCL
jgi:hypothetical protein